MYDKKRSIGNGLYMAVEHGIDIYDATFYGILNEDGKEVIPVAFEKIEHSDQLNVFVCKGFGEFKYHVYNKDGNSMGDYLYAEYADDEGKTPAAVVEVEKDKFNLVDINGKLLLDQNYDKFVNMKNGLVAFEKEGKLAIFNTDGEQLTPFEYDFIRDYKYGMVVCCKNGKDGVYDKNMNLVVPFAYDYIYDYDWNHTAVVRNGQLEGLVNDKNKVVIGVKYDRVRELTYDYIEVKDRNGKYGIYNKDGKVILPCECDKIKYFEPSAKYIPAIIKGKEVFADADGKLYQGKEAIEIKYQLKKQDLKFSSKKFLPIRYKLLDVQKKIEMKKYDKEQTL